MMNEWIENGNLIFIESTDDVKGVLGAFFVCSFIDFILKTYF
jgi:hypothetical protein